MTFHSSLHASIWAWVLSLGLASCVPEEDGPPCTRLQDCCSHSPSALCDEDTGTCVSNPFCAQDPNCFGSRWGACSAGPSTPDAGPIPNQCPSFPANSRTLTQPMFFCGQPGPLTAAFMSDLNLFWQSSMVSCGCDDATSLSSGCQSNAMVLAQTPSYIYYDRNMLDYLARTTGLGLSAAWFLAHEAGHNVQLSLNLQYSSGKARELGADCFAGYFVAWLECTGRINWSYSNAALMTACQVGDPFVSGWFSPGAHGTCPERQEAVQRGLSSYKLGQEPWRVCTF
jgi:hypothetical protein